MRRLALLLPSIAALRHHRAARALPGAVDAARPEPGAVAGPAADASGVDRLTGLPDRGALHAALLEALAPRAAPSGPPTAPAADLAAPGPVWWDVDEDEESGLVALVLIDLDAFKDVNDRFGHGAGDAVLRATALRVAACLPEGSVLARLGGDEFAVLLRGSEAAQARLVADRAAAAVAAAPQDGSSWRATASVGVAFGDAPEDDDDDGGGFATGFRTGAGAGAGAGVHPEPLGAAEELLRRAEAAMYSAKATGGGVRLYDPAGDRAKRERSLLAEELHAALAGVGEPDRGETAELVVHYQAQVEARGGRVGGLEALVRWRHPRHGLIGPEAFLGIAEEQDLMTRLTERVLRTALLDARTWHAAGHRVRVAVNVSATCLTSPALLPMVDAALAESGVEPQLLVVEVTETTLMSEPQQALATARRLRERGVQLSIDDYGTGYSSLSYLSDLPATELKLDRAFTGRVLTDATTAAIVASTVDLAHRLGLRLVVEGVEDAETLAAVHAVGCDDTQGFLHGRAEPAAEVVRRLVRDAAGSGPLTPPAPARVPAQTQATAAEEAPV